MKLLTSLTSLAVLALTCSAARPGVAAPAIAPTAVPEPSTYGIIAVVALAGLVAARRFTRRQK